MGVEESCFNKGNVKPIRVEESQKERNQKGESGMGETKKDSTEKPSSEPVKTTVVQPEKEEIMEESLRMIGRLYLQVSRKGTPESRKY